jgi:hypothetical protein
MGLTEAVREGRLRGLEALRDVLAAEIAAGPSVDDKGRSGPSQTAPLARQLQDVLRQIEELEKAQPKGSFVDELAKRRRAPQGSVAAG